MVVVEDEEEEEEVGVGVVLLKVIVENSPLLSTDE